MRTNVRQVDMFSYSLGGLHACIYVVTDVLLSLSHPAKAFRFQNVLCRAGVEAEMGVHIWLLLSFDDIFSSKQTCPSGCAWLRGIIEVEEFSEFEASCSRKFSPLLLYFETEMRISRVFYKSNLQVFFQLSSENTVSSVTSISNKKVIFSVLFLVKPLENRSTLWPGDAAWLMGVLSQQHKAPSSSLSSR